MKPRWSPGVPQSCRSPDHQVGVHRIAEQPPEARAVQQLDPHLRPSGRAGLRGAGRHCPHTCSELATPSDIKRQHRKPPGNPGRDAARGWGWGHERASGSSVIAPASPAFCYTGPQRGSRPWKYGLNWREGSQGLWTRSSFAENKGA